MANYKLLVNSTNVLDKTNNITWTSNADSFGVELSFDSLYNLPTGAIVSLYINNKEHFRGIILTKSDTKFVYSYKCLDFSHYFKNEVVKQFKNIAADNAITSILSEYGIKSIIASMPTKISKWYIDETIESIIDDIITTASKDQQKRYFKEITGATVYINEIENMRIAPKIYINKDYTVDETIEHVKNKVIVATDKGKILAVAENKASQSLLGLLQQVEKADKDDKAKANALAKSTLNSLVNPIKSTSLDLLVVEGFETIRANRQINIKSGDLNGWFDIKTANHTLTKGQHKIQIDLEWQGVIK